MKHKQYEIWILEEKPLTPAQQEDLNAHLLTCDSCRALKMGWIASKQLITQSKQKTPSPGFTNRWQKMVQTKQKIEEMRTQRLTLFGLVAFAFLGSIGYMFSTNSFVQIFVNSLTMISELTMDITSVLSSFGNWFEHLPIAVPLTVGFLLFGFFSAFMLIGAFFFLNIKQRKLHSNEIKME